MTEVVQIIRWLILAVTGLAAGGIISAGVFSFITSIGIIPRIAGNMHMGKYIRCFENIVIIGGITGGALSVFQIKMNLGIATQAMYGIMSGIFVGCLAVALAETLNAMAVFTRRVHLQKGLRVVIYAIALGKITGSLLYFLKL